MKVTNPELGLKLSSFILCRTHRSHLQCVPDWSRFGGAVGTARAAAGAAVASAPISGCCLLSRPSLNIGNQ